MLFPPLPPFRGSNRLEDQVLPWFLQIDWFGSKYLSSCDSLGLKVRFLYHDSCQCCGDCGSSWFHCSTKLRLLQVIEVYCSGCMFDLQSLIVAFIVCLFELYDLWNWTPFQKVESVSAYYWL